MHQCTARSLCKKYIRKTYGVYGGTVDHGGDLNAPPIPSEDTSSGTSSVSPKIRKGISQAIAEARLVDIWRLLHPKEKDYSFFSNPHRVYSRIDVFFVPHKQLPSVREASIGLITWSDHAPVF